MTSTNDAATDEEVLEAERVYILMKREYRISRNARAEWYLRRINGILTFPRREKLSDEGDELEVVSVIPFEVPPEWDSDTSHLYRYHVTHRTRLHFLARKYRLVFCLDLSPSTWSVDAAGESVRLDQAFYTLARCLKGIVRPFYVPGSLLLFQPEIYLTIIGHTPFPRWPVQQVLVQGWLLAAHNLDHFLDTVHHKLTALEAQLAQATAQSYIKVDTCETDLTEGGGLGTGGGAVGTAGGGGEGDSPTSPLFVTPDIGFVDMLRYGIVALQLLPENSSAGIVVITDGVISLPDATSFESLLVQLRNQTVACSFLQLGSVYHPQGSLGYVPFTDLMAFLASATCGAYMSFLPEREGGDYDYYMNDYHKSLLSWGFQTLSCPTPDLRSSPALPPTSPNGWQSLLPTAPETMELIRKKEREHQLATSLSAVLSCRLREGYAIRQVSISDDQIQLVMVLPWKYSVFIEYHIRSAWPLTQAMVNVEVWIEATYEFLNDVTSEGHGQLRSQHRRGAVGRYWGALQHLRHTDMLLVGFQSFPASPSHYTVPECVRNGHPVFYHTPGRYHHQPPVLSDATSDQYPQFSSFWRPVCLLDSNVWQKWLHTHRVGVILAHDHPLPKNLHLTSASGRYGVIHCRQAELALTTLLAEWSDFILIENYSYVKFLYGEGQEGQDRSPVSFLIVRVTSKPPPCLVIRLAFLGGTPGHVRNQMVGQISAKIQRLTFPSRVTLTERSKSLPPATLPHQDKLDSDMTISASSDLRPPAPRPPLSRASSSAPCCVITHKPVEKILIWYNKTPNNPLNPLISDSPYGSSGRGGYGNRAGGGSKAGNHNMALLARYLHHRRWVWGVQAPSSPAVTPNAVARVLNCLTRLRLQEGFNFAHSCNGIITMVRECDMKLELSEVEEKGMLGPYRVGGEGATGTTYPCVVQYVIFPPHLTNSSKDSLVEEEGEEEEGDSVEADGEMQMVTECWVEPQNGVVVAPAPTTPRYLPTILSHSDPSKSTDVAPSLISSLSPSSSQIVSSDSPVQPQSLSSAPLASSSHLTVPQEVMCDSSHHQATLSSPYTYPDALFHHCNYRQLAQAFFPVDQQCIWVLMTVEHLLLMCHDGAVAGGGAQAEPMPRQPPTTTTTSQDPPRVLQVPFNFDLLRLLPMCQQVELLVSTYIQDLLSSLVRHVTFDCHSQVDKANCTLYGLLLDHLAQLHQGREFPLSLADHLALPALLASRPRPHGARPSPFSNTSVGKGSDPPKWRCFLRGISSNHLLLTLLPASYQDLKLLLVRRANISDPSNLALKMLPSPHIAQHQGQDHQNLDMEGNVYEDMHVEGHEGLAHREDLLVRGEGWVGDGAREDGLRGVEKNKEIKDETCGGGGGGVGRWEQCGFLGHSNVFSSPTSGPGPLCAGSRVRYKSGPAPHSPFPVPLGPVPIRERASSLHIGWERCGSFSGRPSVSTERNRAASVDSKEQPENITPATERGRTKSADWHTRDQDQVSPKPETHEHVRQRYVSMPSKSHTCAFTPGVISSSTEGLKSVDGCIPLHLHMTDIHSQGRGARMGVLESQVDGRMVEGRVNPIPTPPPLPPTHTLMYGAVTLPIYVFDCKLSSITAQLINSADRASLVGKNIYLDSTSKLLPETSGGEEVEEDYLLDKDNFITTTTVTPKVDSSTALAPVTTSVLSQDTTPVTTPSMFNNITATTPTLKVDLATSATSITEDLKRPSPEPRSEESDAGVDQSHARSHALAVEAGFLRGYVTGMFRALVADLPLRPHDVQAALDHCHETVTEVPLTPFLQTICGHLRDFRLHNDLENLRHNQSDSVTPCPHPYPTPHPDQATPRSPADQGDRDTMSENTAKETTQANSSNPSEDSLIVVDKSPIQVEKSPPIRAEESVNSTPKFPLSLLKLHQPCHDLQQLHSSIRERFSAVLQGSFHQVPSLSDYYYFSPHSLHRSSESDVFTEGEEDLDDSTVNGEEEEEGEEEDAEDKSIVFRSDLGSIAYRRQLSQLTDGGDHISEHDEHDDDLSTLGDGPVPPLFLHLTCSVRLAGHLHTTCPVRTVPTCLDELVSSLSEREVDLSSVSVTLDVLCMTLPPAAASATLPRAAPTVDAAPSAGLDLSRSARTTSFCSTASPPQPRHTHSLSESTCASLSDMDESFLEEEDQLGHLPNYQHQAVLATVDEIKWLLRDEIASAMLHTYPLTEAILEMVAAHVESSRHARNCISEAVPLSFVCGVEQSRQRFMEEFGRLSVGGHQLQCEGSLYYLVQAKTSHHTSRRRHLSSLVPPLSFHNQELIGRLHPHADDMAQLRQMDATGVCRTPSLSSPDPLLSPPATNRFQPPRVVSFDAECCTSENLEETEIQQQQQRGGGGGGGGGGGTGGSGEEKEKWMRRRERKERRDSERRGSVDTSDSDSDITQTRSHFSRESSHPPHDSRLRCSESPKKTPAAMSTPLRKPLERRLAVQGGDMTEDDEKDDMEEDFRMESEDEHFNAIDNEKLSTKQQSCDKEMEDGKGKEDEEGDLGAKTNQASAKSLEKYKKEPLTRQRNLEGSFGLELELCTTATSQVKDRETGEEVLETGVQPPVTTSEDDRSASKHLTEGRIKQRQGTNGDENGDKQEKNQQGDEEHKEKLPEGMRDADKHLAMSVNQEDEGDGRPSLVSRAGDVGHRVMTDTQRLAKESTHRLSLPLNELIRCGTESLPHSIAPTDIIRKSASIDSFVAAAGRESTIDTIATDHLRSHPVGITTMSCGGGLWAEFIKSRHNSSEMTKSRHNSSEMTKSRNSSGGASVDLHKSRHNSGTGGELLKSCHNSGTGSGPCGGSGGYGGGGPQSDASSLLESGQTTEDGCEGDISDSEDDCCDWLQDYEPARAFLPPFWLILRLSADHVHTFFHCRTESEAGEWRGVQGEVVRSVRSLVKLVNQTLLLQDLHNTRMCNGLLEPEVSDDIWRHEDTKGRGGNDSESEYQSYLAASFKFKAGVFACQVVWETQFELHPKVYKLCAGKVGSKAIQALRTILNPFSVNNRKNMFVYEDITGNGHVFYLRLKEVQSLGSGEGRGRVEEVGLALTSSVNTHTKRDDPQATKNPQELRPRVSSFGEKDVIMEGVPSAPAHRRRSHHILLTVHGIADPGPAIKEELVRMLQNRLDEAVVEAICVMLWSNPQHKLTPEDVHFIQPPYQPPKAILRFTLNACALPHLQAAGYYMRQNMLSCGFINPKYADTSPEHHFQDFSATDQDLSNEPNIFLFVRPRKSAAKGIACIAFSLVDGSGCVVQHLSCARPSPRAYQEVFSSQDFETMTHTQEYHASPTKRPGPMALLQFKVWESGRVDLEEVRRHLLDSARHALWDLTTEYRLLTAPILPVLLLPQSSPAATPASEPTTPKKGKRLVRGSVSSGGSGDSRGGDGHQRERAPSPLTLVQSDVAASTHGGGGGTSHSPLKVRHSVDLGVERNRLLHADEGQAGQTQQPWEHLSGPVPPQARLHSMYSSIMVEWLEWAGVLDDRGDHQARKELGEKGGEHAVKKHTVRINSRHSVPIFLTELRKWMGQHCADTTTHIFVQESPHHLEPTDPSDSPAYILVDPSKLCQVVEHDPMGGYVDKNFVVVGRNNQQWWATLYEDNYNDYYLNAVTSSKSSQRYQPLVVSPRGRCVSGGTDTTYTRPDPSYTCPDPSHAHPDPARPDSSHTRPSSTSAPSSSTLGLPITSSSPATIPVSSPVTVPSTPTSLTSGSRAGIGLWGPEAVGMVFVPRQKLLLATLHGLELIIYTYNWTKEQCDSLHSAVTRLSQWSTARSRLLATLVLQKMGLYYNQPFVRKASKEDEDYNNLYLGNHSYTDSMVKLQAPPRDSPVTSDRPTRRLQGALPPLNLTELRESRPPIRSRLGPQYGHLKDLELRHGTQMADIRRHVLQKETQRKVLLKTVVETRGNSSPAFTDKILALYKQHARLVHFCYTPLLFLPRWRWHVAVARDHSLVSHPSVSSSPTDKAPPTKTPEPRSRHDSGSSIKGVSGVNVSGISNSSDLRRSLSLRSTSTANAIPSPGQQRQRHMTGGGDEKWHDSLCSSYLKEYIQYLQSLGFLTLNVTQVSQQRGHNRQSIGRDSENRGFRGKEVRFSEQATKQPTYLLKNVLGGTILLQIAFLQPYFSAKIYVLESCRLEGKRVSSQFAINSFLDKVDDIKVLLHMHSFTYDFHLRAVCAYVADRQLLFAPGYHLSSCLSDFIKYYNKGPNFARNLIYSGALTIEDTGTPGEQLYNYLLAREKHYRMRVLRMTPVMIDPDAEMHYTEFILVHNKTCHVHYRDGNDQRVADEYDVTLLVSHNTSPGSPAAARLDEPRPNILHLNFYVILTSTREMYPNRILEKKMGRFRTVSVSFAPTLNKRWTPSSTHTESREHSGSDTPPAVTDNTATVIPKASTEEATVSSQATPAAEEDGPPSTKSYTGIRSESVNYLGYYTQYEETMQRTLQTQAEEARNRIHHIFNQAKIHCRRDSLWQRLTAGLRDEDKQKLPREQVVGGLGFSEISELLDLVSVEPLSLVDPQLLPLLSKPLHWYQALTRVLQAKYQDRHRSLTSSDGNIQHVAVLSSACPDAFMMLSINLHHQKAELCCVNKQLKGEGTTRFSDRRVQILVEDFVNACCFHLWSGLL